jgi:hypothetical protein
MNANDVTPRKKALPRASMLDARASDPPHSKQQVPNLLFSLNRYEGVVVAGYGTTNSAKIQVVVACRVLALGNW